MDLQACTTAVWRAHIRLRRTQVRVLPPLQRKPGRLEAGFFALNQQFMEEYVVYVLYSQRCGRIYIGYTSGLINRFKSHNFLSKKGYTIRCRPWFVVLTEFFDDKLEAMKREKELKSGKGREWIYKHVL